MGATNLVNHHDCEQIADGSKEQTVKIVLDAIADGIAKDIQDDLSNDEEENTENNVAHWPAVLERAQNEDDLADEIDKQEDGVDNVCDNEDTDGVLSIQTGPVLESKEGDGSTNDEHAKGGQAQQPD